MSRIKFSRILITLAFALIFTGCGTAINGTPTDSPEVIMTRVAQTVFYSVTQTAQAKPTSTSTPIPPTPTVTIIQLPTIQTTKTSSSPLIPTTQAVSPGSHSGDYALYLYNTPDNFHMSPGQPFNGEVIAYENIGTTTWNTGYTLRFFGGTKMWDITSVNLTQTVAPGQRVEIFIAGIAPVDNGTYLNRWALYTDGGTFVPGSEMYVKIFVP